MNGPDHGAGSNGKSSGGSSYCEAACSYVMKRQSPDSFRRLVEQNLLRTRVVFLFQRVLSKRAKLVLDGMSAFYPGFEPTVRRYICITLRR